VLTLSPRVIDGSPYLVPQALVNVLAERDDELYIGKFTAKRLDACTEIYGDKNQYVVRCCVKLQL